MTQSARVVIRLFVIHGMAPESLPVATRMDAIAPGLKEPEFLDTGKE
jgi:hypothetical protein